MSAARTVGIRWRLSHFSTVWDLSAFGYVSDILRGRGQVRHDIDQGVVVRVA